MASIEGSIQSLREQVELQRTRADEATAKWLVAQTKLNEISPVVNHVFHDEALRTNHPLLGFAYSIAKILDGEG